MKQIDKTGSGDLLNIVYKAGTFGHFLKYFTEKFSRHTPDITDSPFTDIGTGHGLVYSDYSGRILIHHSDFTNTGIKGLPTVTVTARTRYDLLYIMWARLYRVDNLRLSPDMLWQKAIGEMPELLRPHLDSIIGLYDIKEKAHYSWIPKFIVRDWYKLEFLKPLNEMTDFRIFKEWEDRDFWRNNRNFTLDLSCFFDWNKFSKAMMELDRFHSLELDFDRSNEMKTVFEQGLKLDKLRQSVLMLERLLENDYRYDISTKDLNVIEEAFIYAHYERKHPTIQMPVTNRFFRDSEEIKQFIDNFPNWYRRKNPNLPQK